VRSPSYPDGSLRKALQEMRAELDGLIRREMARLLARSNTEGDPAASEAGDPPRTTRVDSYGDRVGPRAVQAGDLPAGTAPFPTPSPAHVGEIGHADDARSRLEALARRLEGRLKPS
jgi:hypothetical protein